jgi:hypothetical protein
VERVVLSQCEKAKNYQHLLEAFINFLINLFKSRVVIKIERRKVQAILHLLKLVQDHLIEASSAPNAEITRQNKVLICYRNKTQIKFKLAHYQMT